MHDDTGIEECLSELGLVPVVVHDISEVSDKEKCPHIDTIIVDSLSIVSFDSLLLCMATGTGQLRISAPELRQA
jgi:hypothetical protein